MNIITRRGAAGARHWIAAAIAATAVMAAACGNSSTGGGSPLTVQVQDVRYVPATDTVGVGQTVTWTWGSGTAQSHDIVFEDGAPGSPLQSAGSFTRQFASTGAYRYRCTPHSTSYTAGMVGVIVVR